MTNVKAQIEIEVVDHVSAATAKAEQAIQSLAQAELQAANATKVLATASLERAQTAAAGATSVEGLARAELNGANASRQLARAEIQAAKASATLATSARNASAATASLTPAAGTATAAVGRITQAQKAQGLGMAQNINLVSELAMGFGNMSPATRGLGLAFATAGNNAFALASALGPMGVVIGSIVGVAPALISMFRDMGTEAEDAASAIDGARRSFNELVSAQTSARRDQESEEDLFSGAASSETVQDALDVVRRQQDAARSDENKQLRQSSALGGTFAPLTRELMAAEDFDENGVSPEAFQEANERLGTNAGAFQGAIIQQLEALRGRRTSSTGSSGLEARMERLRAGLAVAQERERQDAFEEDVQADRDVSVRLRRTSIGGFSLRM